MKRQYLSIILYFVLSTMVVVCGDQEELFLRANTLYQEKKYAQALELYAAIENKGPAVWYNMGNCYYHINDQCNAYIAWNRAKKGAPVGLYKQIDATLARHLTVDTSPSIFHHYSTPLQAHLASISLLMLQMLFLLFLYVTWMLYAWYPQSKKYWARMCCAFLCAGIMALLVVAKYVQQSYQDAVIVAENAVVYAGPAVTYVSLDTLHRNNTVRVQSESGDWYKIKCTSGKMGWVSKDDICLI